MAFQYASYVNPQPQESSLAALLPAFEAGQQQRKDELAAQAFASLGRAPGQAPSALADLSAPQQPQQPQPTVGPDGHPVAVGDRAADLTAYQSGVAARESGGNPTAVNPRSGATGTYQFLPSTWQDVSARHPELGLTPDGITDPAQQQKAMQVFTSENARQLQANGIPPSPANLYAAHFLGAAGATKALSAPDQTPMSAVAPAAVAENPNIANMTVGDFKAWAGQNGGNASGGYAPPAAQQSQPTSASPASGGFALPDRNTMLALFRSPDTRPLAISLIQTMQKGQDPSALLEMALNKAKLAEAQQSLTKPQEVNAGATLVDPVTHQPIYTAPARTNSAAATPPASIREYDYYRQQAEANGEKPMSYMDFRKSAATGGFNANQSLAAGYADRMREADQVLSNPKLLDAQTSPVQSAAGSVPFIGNYLETSDRQVTDQAQRDFVNAILRRESGAAISSSEFDSAKKQYFPQPGDSSAVIEQKTRNRSTAINGLVRAAGPNYTPAGGSAPAGASDAPQQPQSEEPTQISGDDEYDALPSGAQFIGPDGQLRQKP